MSEYNAGARHGQLGLLKMMAIAPQAVTPTVTAGGAFADTRATHQAVEPLPSSNRDVCLGNQPS